MPGLAIVLMYNPGMTLQAPLLVLLFTTACAVRYPTVVPIREQQFRSHDQPATLPLQKDDRAEFDRFLSHGGNRFGRNPSPDGQASGHKQILDALEKDANLTIRGDLASSDFCAIAAPLCGAAPIFRKRIAVTQVIDARERQPAVPDPIAVCDDEYCWVFRQAGNRLTGVVVVRSVKRGKP
jgi:hypothetical protein